MVIMLFYFKNYKPQEENLPCSSTSTPNHRMFSNVMLLRGLYEDKHHTTQEFITILEQ